jgi:Phosphotransferase enzyme family
VIDAAGLAEILRASGALTHGEVASVALRESDAFNSATVFAEVTYRGADPRLPTRLVIKCPSEAAWSRAAAVIEAGFYRYVATLPDHPPVVPACLAATDDCLVLADLSPTHVAPVSRAHSIALSGVPTMDALDAAVDTLAALHAYWWRRDPGPFEVATWWGEREQFDAYAHRRRHSWTRIADQVPEPARTVYQSIVDGLDRFGERLRRNRRGGPLTMVHGDAYLSNFLLPANGSGLGVLLDWTLVPVQDAADGSRRDYWWPKMCCLLDAFADHGAAELFT